MSPLLRAVLCCGIVMIAHSTCNGPMETCAKGTADEAALVQKDFQVHKFETAEEQYPGAAYAQNTNPKGLNINVNPAAALQHPAAPKQEGAATPGKATGHWTGIPGIPTQQQINPKGLNINPDPTQYRPPPGYHHQAAEAARAAAEKDDEMDDETFFKKATWCPTFDEPGRSSPICGLMVFVKNETGAEELEGFLSTETEAQYYKLKTLSEVEGHPVFIVNYPLSQRRRCCETMYKLHHHPGIENAIFDRPDKETKADAGEEYSKFVQTPEAGVRQVTPSKIAEQALLHPESTRPMIQGFIDKTPKADVEKWFNENMPTMFAFLKDHMDLCKNYKTLSEGFEEFFGEAKVCQKDKSGAGRWALGVGALASVSLSMLL